MITQEVTIKKIKKILELDSQLIQMNIEKTNLNQKWNAKRDEYYKSIDELFKSINEPTVYIDGENSFLIDSSGIHQLKTIKNNE